MLRLLLPFLAAFSLLAAQATPQTGGPDPIPTSGPGSKPLRVFLRSGPKSHGPGDHDHPSFLRDWVPLLNARGAIAKGGDVFPTAAELAETDVLIIHRQVGGNFKPAERALIDAYAQRGRSEEHTSELQSHHDLVCRLLLEKKKQMQSYTNIQHD